MSCFLIREKQAIEKHTKTDIGEQMLHLFNLCFSFWQDPQNIVSAYTERLYNTMLQNT